MRAAILAAAWVTPALVAGALGWAGIWGSGSALVDFLIPVPVAGGALHVPGFVALAAALAVLPRLSPAGVRWMALAGLAILAAALAGQVDAVRLGAWLTTDYEPYGSPLRLQENPLLLFVTTDAFWLVIACLSVGGSPAPAAWLVAPAVVLVVTGLRLGGQVAGDPAFTVGTPMPGPARGDLVVLVHAPGDVDDASLRGWLDGAGQGLRPWDSVNDEHVAVVFTRSRQLVEWRQVERIAGPETLATACLYEEDRSIVLAPGYSDCFAGRLTVAERLDALPAAGRTGLGAEVDEWYRRHRLCAGVVVPSDTRGIALHDFCRPREPGPDRTVEALTARYGADSAQVAFVVAARSGQ
jgi:hypothetical protein